MFETVIPERTARKSRLLKAETLPVSIAAHLGAMALFVLAGNWAVAFPGFPPKLSRAYSLVDISPPPPPPPPPPVPPPAGQPVRQVLPFEQPGMETAPTIIPDKIPEVMATLPLPVSQASAPGVEGGVPGGVPGGEVGGVVTGTPGGVVIAPAPPPDGKVHIARDRRLPMHALSQVYPLYPESARIRLKEGQLVVRYTIGKDGRVKDVIVIDHADDQSFDDSAVRAIRNWRFSPLIKDGEATEVVHELTVFFRLEAEG
jgi:periplasmic protein TonB